MRTADRKTAGKISKKKPSGILRQKGGFTLVELIVTFALISMFAVASSQIISNAIEAYHKIRGMDNAVQAADTLMDKITGVLTGAHSSLVPGDPSVAVKITNNGTMVELRDRTASHVCITTTEQKEHIPQYEPTAGDYPINQLLIYYYGVLDEEKADNLYNAVDWTFDEAVYMGCQIKSLKFALADQTVYPANVIKIDLALAGKGITYSTTRFVRCYNLDAAEHLITDDNGGGSGGIPDNPGGGGDNPPQPEEPQDEFVKALGDYLLPEDSWKTETIIVDGQKIEIKYKKVANRGGDDDEPELVIVKRTDYDKKYPGINKDDIEDEIEDFVKDVLKMDDDALIYIDKSKCDDDVDDLVEALGGNFEEDGYEIKHLYFDPSNGNLMAVEYKHKKGDDKGHLWGYYGNYTKDDIKRIHGEDGNK